MDGKDEKLETNQEKAEAKVVEESAAPPAKKLRINEQAEFITTSKAEEANASGGEEDEQGNEEICSLCMEVGTEDCPILEDHQCPQCAPGAWKICQVCNESLLSRTCPVCRGEYAPILMYPMPGKHV